MARKKKSGRPTVGQTVVAHRAATGQRAPKPMPARQKRLRRRKNRKTSRK